MLGPLFYVIKVAKRSDSATVYLGSKMEGGRYKRELLDDAARYIDRERAADHLFYSNEIGPEVVGLHWIRFEGNWRAWHETEEDGQHVLNGPMGETVRKMTEGDGAFLERFPWGAYHPEGQILADNHGKQRRFKTPLTARKALERAIRTEYESHIQRNGL